MGTLRRNPIRDSIRVAKRRDIRAGGGQSITARRAITTDGVLPRYYQQQPQSAPPQQQHHDTDREAFSPAPETVYESVSDAADPPVIPRYLLHGRARSNTTPWPQVSRPPSSYRNFSSPVQTPVSPTYGAATSVAMGSEAPPLSRYNSNNNNTNNSLRGLAGSSMGGSMVGNGGTTVSSRAGSAGGWHSAQSTFSRRDSDTSVTASINASVSVAHTNASTYVEPQATSTMRMDAFIKNNQDQNVNRRDVDLVS